MIEFNYLRSKYSELFICFVLIDRFAERIKSFAESQKTEYTITFVDYIDEQEYYVCVSKVNELLDYYFNINYFKIVLSGSDFYNKVKKICLHIDKDQAIFDLFFRSLFLAIKERDSCSRPCNKQYIKDVVYWTVMNAYSTSFCEIPKNIDTEKYSRLAKKFLSELEKQGLICFNQNDITRDQRLKSYFFTSCDTFKFTTKTGKGFKSCISPMFEYLDLKLILENQANLKGNLLYVLDRTIQTLIICSFKDARYENNEFSDNSFIKEYNLYKNA